ncbi:MAG: tyrosine-type recombinase/integrase [Myxococcaceae bacterium]
MSLLAPAIKSLVPQTLALDTSALGNLLDDEPTRRSFVATLHRRHASAFICDVVLFELSSDADSRGVLVRLRALKALCREAGSLIFRAPDHKELIREEMRRWLKGAPAHNSDWSGITKARDSELVRVARKLGDSHVWMVKKKDDLFRTDRGLHEFLVKRGVLFTPEQLSEEICGTRPPRLDEMMIEMAVELSEGKRNAGEIVKDRHRFKATHTVSHLVWRLCLANSIEPAKCRGEAAQILGLWRTKGGSAGRGTWYDTFIAGAASYAPRRGKSPGGGKFQLGSHRLALGDGRDAVSVRRWKRRRTNPATGEVNEDVGWQVDVKWRVPGTTTVQRHRRVLRTRRDAEAHERHVRKQMAEGMYGVEVKEALTVAEFAPRFLEWSRLHNKPSTVAAKEVALRVHLLPGLGGVNLDAAELRAEVESYKQRTLAAGLSAKSVNNTLAVLGKLLSLAAEWGLVQHTPRVPRLRAEKPDFAFLDFDEAEHLVAAAECQWRTWLLVLLRTGLRVGEALALKWRDVDLAAGQLRIRATRWQHQEHSPKGNRERVVPLSGDALAALKAYRHLRTYVFDHEDGRPYTHSEVKEVVPRACAAARLGKRVTTHGLRHTFASHCVMRGASLLEVKELLGYADLSMVLRYAHLAPSRLRDAVQVLDRPPQLGAT